MTKFVYYNSIFSNALRFLLFFVVLVVVIVGGYLGRHNMEAVHGSDALIGYSAMLLFLLGGFWGCKYTFKRLIDRRIQIIVDENGVEYQRWWWKRIPWSNVKSFRMWQASSAVYLALTVKDPTPYLVQTPRGVYKVRKVRSTKGLTLFVPFLYMTPNVWEAQSFISKMVESAQPALQADGPASGGPAA